MQKAFGAASLELEAMLVEFEQPPSPLAKLLQRASNESTSAHDTNASDAPEGTASTATDPQRDDNGVQAACFAKDGGNTCDTEQHWHYVHQHIHTQLGGLPALPMLSRILPRAADLVGTAAMQGKTTEADCDQ